MKLLIKNFFQSSCCLHCLGSKDIPQHLVFNNSSDNEQVHCHQGMVHSQVDNITSENYIYVFNPEEGGSILLRNIGTHLQVYNSS